MFHVYILYSQAHNRFYIGQTNNIEKRIIRHNSGYVKSTKHYRPWKVLLSETYNSRKEAMNRETQIKSWKSKLKIQELIDASR
jgi:putative endonuclease